MKKRLWIPGICIVLILSLIFGTFAAYTSRSYVKGVATTPKHSLALSSDYLTVIAQSAPPGTYAVKKILLDEKSEEDDTPYSFSFYIQNSSDGSVSEKSMQYNLKISGLPEGASVFRDKDDITGYAGTGEGAESPLMAAYSKAVHTYTIQIPKESINSLGDLVITAVPNTDSDSSGNMLAAKLQFSIAGVSAGFSYKGVFLDETQANYPWEFAAFNYEVLISNASEAHTMVLTWDPGYVEIDPLFLEKIGVSSGNSGNLEFSMDSQNSSYLIKFYRLKGQNEDEDWQKSWENLKKIITFSEKEQIEVQ